MLDDKIPTCHPDKPYGAKGLCKTCYMRAYRNGGVLPDKVRERGRVPDCHPDRRHRAHGLCVDCYLLKYRRDRGVKEHVPAVEFATCHPDRPHKAKGLCKPCYDATPVRRSYIHWYNTENRRRDLLKHRYGITVEEYDAKLNAQGGVCAICKQPPRGKTFRLAVDHDHATDDVRGLLCITCNRVIGYLENDQWREAADAYLAKYNHAEGIYRHQGLPEEAGQVGRGSETDCRGNLQ